MFRVLSTSGRGDTGGDLSTAIPTRALDRPDYNTTRKHMNVIEEKRDDCKERYRNYKKIMMTARKGTMAKGS